LFDFFYRVFFLSRFWAFRNKGSSKTRLQKSRENLLGLQKKYLLTYVAFFFSSFSAVPLVGTRLLAARPPFFVYHAVWRFSTKGRREIKANKTREH
jgi:hypothetical protein